MFTRPKRRLPWKKKIYYLDEELFQFVADLAEEQGCTPEAAAAELVALALAQRDRVQRALECWQKLTAREQQVAALTCLGYSSGQIARRLQITPDTVRCHLRKLLPKFHLVTKSGLRLALSASAGWDFRAWEAAGLNPDQVQLTLTKLTSAQETNQVT